MTAEQVLEKKRKPGRPKKIRHTGPTRPWKMTDEVLQKLEYAFAIDSTVEEACAYAEIAESTFYEWQKKNTLFSERIDRLRQQPILKARQTVVTALVHKNEIITKNIWSILVHCFSLGFSAFFKSTSALINLVK